jgi:ketosteroid isomerase-like protein
VRFDIQEILVSDDRAVIVGELASTINATGKLVESDFALILTVSDGEISRFNLIEDSFAVSQAERG